VNKIGLIPFKKKKKNPNEHYISVQYAGDGKNMRGWIPMSKREYALWLQINADEKKQKWRLLFYSAGSLDSLHKTEADRQRERYRISKLSSTIYQIDQSSKKRAKVKDNVTLQQHSPKSPKKNHPDPKIGENKEASSTKKAKKKRRGERKWYWYQKK